MLQKIVQDQLDPFSIEPVVQPSNFFFRENHPKASPKFLWLAGVHFPLKLTRISHLIDWIGLDRMKLRLRLRVRSKQHLRSDYCRLHIIISIIIYISMHKDWRNIEYSTWGIVWTTTALKNQIVAGYSTNYLINYWWLASSWRIIIFLPQKPMSFSFSWLPMVTL